jgi:DNA repair exonuclease SbcCD ATPase subunit
MTRPSSVPTSRSVSSAALAPDGLAARLRESEAWVLRLAEERGALLREQAALAGRIAALRRERDAARGEAAWLRADRQARRDALSSLDRRVEEAKAHQAALETELTAARADATMLEAALRADIADLASRVHGLSQQKAALDQRLAESSSEVAQLARLLCAAEDKGEADAKRLQWLARVHAVMTSPPRWWWRLVTLDGQRQLRYRRLKRRGLFDAADYAARYPDVRGVDPLVHYITHGMYEGRRI